MAPRPVALTPTTGRLPDAALPDPLPRGVLLPGQGPALAVLHAALARRTGHVAVTGLAEPDRLARLAALVARAERPAAARRDLVYVARPTDPDRPALLVLPPGGGAAFRRDLVGLLHELRLAWPEDLDAGPGRWAEAQDAVFAPVRAAWPAAAGWLAGLQAAVLARAELFRPGVDPRRLAEQGDLEAAEVLAAFQAQVFHRAPPEGPAPVVLGGAEPGPLLGGALALPPERPAHLGLRAGRLHDAHGGVLLLDGRELAADPTLAPRLRTLLAQGALAPDAGPGARLRPDPVPLDVQLLLVLDGTERVAAWREDPDLSALLTEAVQFASWAPADGALAAELAAFLAADLGRPVLGGGVAAVLEHLQRLAGRGGRALLDLGEARGLARRAAARLPPGTALGREAVDGARAADRAARRLAQDQALDQIALGFLQVRTTGASVGECNGLAVYRGSGHAFARPIRISATVGTGRGGLVDVERDVGLSGKAHQKGTRILLGLLRGRFGRRTTLALQASLAIEQHYGQIDGDSASLAEACALISALARRPLRQDLALTGSLDQQGRVQSVGSLALKVEGFYAACARQGLTGSQGVVLPRVNEGDLLLAPEVLEAVAAGRFQLWAVDTLEDALGLLVEGEIGDPDAAEWPAGSLYGAVMAELRELEAVQRRANKGEAPAQK